LADLRPGEPAPFSIEASVLKAEVASVEWSVEYAPANNTPQRAFSILVHQARQFPGKNIYMLFGSIRNLDANVARGTHVIAVWLDTGGRAIYVATPGIRLFADPSKATASADLLYSDFADFIYTTDDSSLVSLLNEADVALWGISNEQ
jgi:hypothetical protein